MTDDAALERDLRAMLAARDPGPARSDLAIRVRTRMRVEVRAGRLAGWARTAGGLAAVAGIAALIVLAVVVGRPISAGPGATVPPGTSVPYAIKPGDGVVAGAQAPVVQGIAAVVVIAALLLVARSTTSRWIRIAASLGCLTVMLIPSQVGTSDAINFRDGAYGVSPGREAPAESDGMYVAVTGDSPFQLGLTITNTSWLPLQVLGLAPDGAFVHADGRVLVPRLVGIGLMPPDVFEPPRSEPFQTFSLQPGGQRDVTILGLAGACAIAAPGPEGQAGYALQTVEIVYEQLTIEHVARIELPAPIVITTPGSCSWGP